MTSTDAIMHGCMVFLGCLIVACAIKDVADAIRGKAK